MAGFKDFVAGEILTAADVDSFLMQQTVMVFDDESARDTALASVLREGMIVYLKSTDELLQYTGSAWELVSTPDWLTNYPEETEVLAATSSGQVLMTTGGTATPVWQHYPSHNYIINGAFDVWQRGDGPFNIAGANANARYTADRWFVLPSGGTGATTKEVFTPNELASIGFGDAKNYLKINCTINDDNYGISQRIEDVRTLAGQSVTLSFWAKGTNPAGGNYTVGLQQFFTGSTVNSFQPLTISSSWQRYSFTFTLGTTAGRTITDSNYLNATIFSPDTTTAPWELNLWGVQLEAGSVATPFKRHAPSLGLEKDACRRFAYQSNAIGAFTFFGMGYASTTTQAKIMIPIPTEMRSRPSSASIGGNLRIVQEGSSSNPVTTVTQGTHSQIGFISLDVNVASGLTVGAIYHLTANNDSSAFVRLESEIL
jgi:hypothetical protein